ncbi:MAG: tetratricopeptide repeat protein [Terriglobales bacterium]
MRKIKQVSVSPWERLIGDLRQKPILLGALLVLATLLLYGRVVHHEFLEFDDSEYVTKNIHVRTGLNFGDAVWAFTSFHTGNWHPLTWLSHMADCQLFGLNPGPPHLVNVVLHAANVLLLFWLLQRATGAVWHSVLVAALFAVHPLNVETVAWVAERKSLLCTLFSLLTIAAYGGYVRRPGWKKYLVVVAAFALALMSKPMAVSLPLVLLLLDYWPLERYEDIPSRRRWVRLLVEKLPLFLMSAASSAITMVAQRSGGAIAVESLLPLSVRVENAVVSYVAYVGKTVWPSKLAVFYPHPEHSLTWADVIAAAVLLAAITMAVLYFHRSRYLAMGWFLFVVTLIPVIGIVQVGRQAMADRYAYIPCIGLFIIIAWGLSDVVTAGAIPRAVPAIAALFLIAAYAVATTRYLPYWQNGVDLFTHARKVAWRPDSMLEEDLAEAMFAAGRLDEAFPHLQEACVLRPDFAYCHYYMAEVLFDRRQLPSALEQYQLAEKLTDKEDLTLSCLINSGQILLELGDYKTAEIRFAAALRIDPNNSTALQLRQQAFNQKSSENREDPAHAPPNYYQQMSDEQTAPLLERLKSDPDNAELLDQIAKTYLSTHQFKEAATYFDRVLRLDPNNVAVRTEMASCMYYDGDVDGAISQLQQSLHYKPKDANSLFNLGKIKWDGKQDGKGALAAWQELLNSNPQLSAERKAEVQKLMAYVQTQGKR